MLKSSLCDYSHACILLKGAISADSTTDQDQDNNDANKKVIFKNCAPFTNYISRINNTQIDDASYIDVVMPIYTSIECSYNHWKTSKILWQSYRDVPDLDNDDAISNFTENNATESLNLKLKLIGQQAKMARKILK